MTTNIKVVRKIIVNGVEYHSLEELPPDVRAKYEKAIGAGLHGGVTLNDQQYASLESLPADIRQTVDDALHPAGPSRRLVATLIIIIAVLAGVILFLLRTR